MTKTAIAFLAEMDIDIENLAFQIAPTLGSDAISEMENPFGYVVTVSSENELAELIEGMIRVPDGHRMLQTIDTASTYTGNFPASDDEARVARVSDLLADHHAFAKKTLLDMACLESPSL